MSSKRFFFCWETLFQVYFSYSRWHQNWNPLGPELKLWMQAIICLSWTEYKFFLTIHVTKTANMKLSLIILSSNRQETLQWRTPSATTKSQNLKNVPCKHLNCILTTKINLSFIFSHKLVSSTSTFPPSSPLGAWTRLSKRMLTITRRLNSISLRRPSLPLWNLSPPLFSLSPNLCRITGYLCSKISGSVTLVFVMWHYTTLVSSQVGPAPLLPPMVS